MLCVVEGCVGGFVGVVADVGRCGAGVICFCWRKIVVIRWGGGTKMVVIGGAG